MAKKSTQDGPVRFERNDALAAEVEDLKSGEAAVEERARNELGMIKPGETFYRVIEPEQGATARDGTGAGQAGAAPPAEGAGVSEAGDAGLSVRSP